MHNTERRGWIQPVLPASIAASRISECPPGYVEAHPHPLCFESPTLVMGLVDERSPFFRIYESADDPSDLPWHRDEPWPMVRQVVEADDDPGRALDLGCGAGEHAVYMARRGYDVTGVDMHQEPLRMARERADRAGVDLTLIHADVLSWEAEQTYDLVLDSGCYHGMPDSDRDTYRARLRRRLSEEGNFVLTHFSKKHIFDWRPVGPYRRRRPQVRSEFSPLFTEVDYTEEEIDGVPLPVGPSPLVGQYWFRQADA